MATETPLFQQYLSIKNEYPDEILFFRLGDFYEMFNEEASEVSRLLNLTLTHRGDIPMCGIPYHASKIYIARLLRLGKKIAIAEQVGEIAHGKGLTERKVVEIITPGTALESEYLESTINSYICSVYLAGSKAGFSYLDVSTGEFKATSFSSQNLFDSLCKEFGRCNPKEILLPDNLKNNSDVLKALASFSSVSVSWFPAWNFNPEASYKRLLKQFNTTNLRAFNLLESSPEVVCAGFLLDYAYKTTNTFSPHITGISVYQDSDYLIIDDSSRRNLEILYNLNDGSYKGTLLDCVNFTSTAMGSRLLREWLMFPLTNLTQIEERQNRVELFYKDKNLLNCVRDYLSKILDIERLASRIAMDKAHAKDLQALKQSLISSLEVFNQLKSYDFVTIDNFSALQIIDLIEKSILEDPSTILTEGRMIKEGWSDELDEWRKIKSNFSSILEDYVEEERQSTGIQNLRIKSSGNMGYFIEVTKGKIDKVPEHFIMKRALVNADRYTTEKLQGLEEKLLESDLKILELEKNLFLEIRNSIKPLVTYLLNLSSQIASIDVCVGFAYAALSYSWTRPEMSEAYIFDITDGRHPVVEKFLPKGEFVPNSLHLNNEKDSQNFALITGPNMAGKSTFLRQNALISLLAQTGSFVPAAKATISIVDRIFCRVGASDNLARGESTFLVEMSETAQILRSATEKSLVIMDEVGRGTSTEDGLSIAWAVSEFLLNRIKCKTLFATHYHELTRLEHKSIKKLCMAVSENGTNIVFLRKVIAGAAENSYGIHVARLAGVPQAVIDRAQVLLSKIQNEKDIQIPLGEVEASKLSAEEKSNAGTENVQKENTIVQNSFTGALFSDEEMILDEILSLDLNNITPMTALQTLSRWKQVLSGR